jgi:hypothetical protein
MGVLRTTLAVAIFAALVTASRGRQPPEKSDSPDFKSDLLNRVVDAEGMLPARWQNREEVLAYEALILHARQFSAEVLSKSANRDLRLTLLLGPDKARYRGQLLHLEGSLRLLERMNVSAGLVGMAEGLEHVWRAWIALDGYEDDLGPVLCAVDFTERQAGLTPTNAVDRRVAVDGFFFKLMKYDTREFAPGGVTEKSPAGKVARLAPLFVARTIRVQAPPASNAVGWEMPAAAVTGSVLFVVIAATAWVGVAWWLRRGDARVRTRLQQLRPGAFAAESAADAGLDVDQNAGRGPFGHSPSAN